MKSFYTTTLTTVSKTASTSKTITIPLLLFLIFFLLPYFLIRKTITIQLEAGNVSSGDN